MVYEFSVMNLIPISTYLDQLSHLRVSRVGEFRSPLKAILLVSVTEMVRDGIIGSPLVPVDEDLKKRFTSNWHKFIQINSPFNANILVAQSQLGGEKFVVNRSFDSFEIERDLFFWMKDPEASELIIATLTAQYLAPFAHQHKVDFTQLNPYRDTSLRAYQADGKAKIYKLWSEMRSVMYQMPTGTGKTKLFVSIAKDLHNWGVAHKNAVKILFLAHRKELIKQIARDVGEKYGLGHGIIMANNMEQRGLPLQVASVQSLIRRIDDWHYKDFDIIIVDEAHHVKASSYITILKAFPRAKVLGVTATPYRMSHESFRPEFDELITSWPVARFIREGWLCDYEYYSIRPESKIQLDINSINRFAMDGDYLDEAAVDVMDKDEIRANILATYERYAKGKKGIIYTITKAHNQHVCDQFKQKGYRVVAIDDSTPSKQRDEYVKDFEYGKIDIICNVNIFSEGFDCPDVEFIQLARPTKSLSMYLQQVGRGLRKSDDKKLIILDNVGLYNRFGFPSAKRQWRRHFEGKDADYAPPVGIISEDGHAINYMDEYIEGEEEVEQLHDSSEEVVEGVTPHQEDEPHSYEPEFRFYLNKTGIGEAEVKRIIRGIKSDIDPIIRGKYDSRHQSVFYMDDIGALELYLFDFQSDPTMAELNVAKNKIMTSALELYIAFLQWRNTEESELEDYPEPEGDITASQKEDERRTLKQVELEISIFQKWDRDIPEGLLKEYRDLSSGH